MDTIYALATARGKSGVAIVRVSGPQAFLACQSLCQSVPEVRRASLRKLKTQDGQVIDEAVVLTFEPGKSFTGEEVVEFQLHGSIAAIKMLLRELSAIPGLRHAEAGEFTRRALENQRLDLAQIEGLADLIEAETDAQHRQATRVFSGRLSETISTWRSKLVKAIALLTATIDFADEDVPVDVMPEVRDLLDSVVESINREVEGSVVAERVRSGFRVAIIGAPNVGKSTLLNYLAGRDVAITSSTAGTTRDVIEVQMDIKGLPVTLIDTAGLRATDDQVEKIGVERARQVAETADIRIHLDDGSGHSAEFKNGSVDIVCLAKDDDGQKGGVSGQTGAGVAELLEKIAVRLEDRVASIGVAVRERHGIAMKDALVFLSRAVEMAQAGAPEEIISEELASAVNVLMSVTGHVGVEDILDEVFSSFCIGK